MLFSVFFYESIISDAFVQEGEGARWVGRGGVKSVDVA